MSIEMNVIENHWPPLEGTLEEIVARHENPMGALANGETPAIILLGAYRQSQCTQLVDRFYERNLVENLPLPGETIPPKPALKRVDIGTSLGNIGEQPEAFFTRARETHALFQTLFEGLDNPVELLYNALSALSPGKTAKTAREPDGRLYGPAIFRCHMPHAGYPPHIDSVRQREKRTGYAVHRFERQLAGILCLQTPDRSAHSCDAIQYRCTWNEELSRLLQTEWTGREQVMKTSFNREPFNRFIAENGIPSCRVVLSPGDMYFFNTEYLHEVPAFKGNRVRIVEATFFGYSRGDPDIFVWS